MKRNVKNLVVCAFAALSLIAGLAGCNMKTEAKKGAALTIKSMKVGGQNVDLKTKKLANEAITDFGFEIEADGEISSVDVTIKGKTKNYPAGTPIAAGMLDVKETGKTGIKFIVHGDKREDASITISADITAGNIDFETLYVGTGQSNEKADLSDVSGSCVVVSTQASAKLTVKTEKAVDKVTVNGKDAKKVSSQQYEYDFSGISEGGMNVEVRATAALKNDAVYKFKLKKGKLDVGVASIKVNGNEVEIGKAKSTKGLTIEFNDENPVKMGAVPIEVELEDDFTKVVHESDLGFVKDTFKKTGNNGFSVNAICYADGAIDGSTANPSVSNVPTNTVTFKVEGKDRNPITITLKLMDKVTKCPKRDHAGIGGMDGGLWGAWTLSTLDEPFRLKFFKKDMFVTLRAKSGAFTLYNKVDKDWKANFVTNQAKFSVGTFKKTPSKEDVDLIFAADKCVAVKVPFGMETLGEYGPSFGIWTEQGEGIEGVGTVMGATATNVAALLSDAGFTYGLPADKLATAGMLLFDWGSGEKITKAEIEKYDATNNTKIDIADLSKKVENLVKTGGALLEDPAGLKTFTKGKKFKYVLKLTFKEGNADKTVTVTAIFDIK